mmetsp:Transcript_9966/g.16074  ORF Transcript_9966/g.16074 Transcript_9966/m.16074 type:complete len:87 (+) Transcript_9966:2343-2603(+)
MAVPSYSSIFQQVGRRACHQSETRLTVRRSDEEEATTAKNSTVIVGCIVVAEYAAALTRIMNATILINHVRRMHELSYNNSSKFIS